MRDVRGHRPEAAPVPVKPSAGQSTSDARVTTHAAATITEPSTTSAASHLFRTRSFKGHPSDGLYRTKVGRHAIHHRAGTRGFQDCEDLSHSTASPAKSRGSPEGLPVSAKHRFTLTAKAGKPNAKAKRQESQAEQAKQRKLASRLRQCCRGRCWSGRCLSNLRVPEALPPPSKQLRWASGAEEEEPAQRR